MLPITAAPAPSHHVARPADGSRALWAYNLGLNTVLDGRSPSIHDLNDDDLEPFWAGCRAARARIEDAFGAGKLAGFDDCPRDVPARYRDAERLAFLQGVDESGEILVAREHAYLLEIEEQAEVREAMRLGYVPAR